MFHIKALWRQSAATGCKTSGSAALPMRNFTMMLEAQPSHDEWVFVIFVMRFNLW